ncbi:MAG: alpha/beta hydrolase [Planctomycetota bacterium]|jgi:phospholipase/carboxylesterase
MAERLPCVEVETGPDPVASIVWLHGLGADGHDFEPIVPALRIPPELPIRFVFPHAPSMPVTINNGFVMPAWYDILEMSIERRVDEDGVRRSTELVETLLAHERERGIPSERIILGGFSQGGAIAAFAGLRHAHPLAGIMILSAYLPLPEKIAEEASIANRATPILQCHGEWDPVVPVGLGKGTAELLQERGYGLRWHGYAAPHTVHPDEATDIGRWIVEVLGRTEH